MPHHPSRPSARPRVELDAEYEVVELWHRFDGQGPRTELVER